MEPMDFDTDTNDATTTQKLSPLPEFNMVARDNQSDLSDMDIDPGSPSQGAVKSSASFNHISNILMSVLSFKNSNDDEAHDKSMNGIPSAPYQENQTASSAGHEFKKTWQPSSTAVLGSVNFRKGKTGYGLPDGETNFSHFPDPDARGHVRKRQPITASHTQVKQMPIDSAEDNYQKHTSHQKHKLLPDSNPPKSYSCLCVICSLLLVILVVIAVHYIIMLYTVYGRDKCTLSRYFNKILLELELKTNVFGQHIAARTVPDKIEEYFSKLHTHSLSQHPTASAPEDICKPLILSFDGWTGVGKNYISKFISETFQNSKIMNYVIPLNFPHRAFEDVYRLQVQQWIIGNFTNCTVNIFVLDEMDKAYPGIIDGLVEAINVLTQPCSSTHPTIIMLLSNTHANDINRMVLKFLLESPENRREQLSANDFSSIFTSELNVWSTTLVRKHFIDAFIPFLPLEKEHVIQCIRRDLVSKGFSTDVGTVNKVLQELSFSSFGDIDLSQTGCKRVADKVDLVMFEKTNLS